MLSIPSSPNPYLPQSEQLRSPVAWQLYREGRLSVAAAARLVKDYPQQGEQCLLAYHVVNGWRLRDAEAAYREAVHAVAAEVLSVNPNVSDNDLHRVIDDRVAGPVRRMECLPGIAPIGTIPAMQVEPTHWPRPWRKSNG